MEQMLQQKILLWGCGARGELAMERFPWLPLQAAIDADPAKQGQRWHGVPVISMETYLERYAELPVLVTPGQSDDIVAFLRAHGRHRFWDLRELMQARENVFPKDDRSAEDAAWERLRWQLIAAVFAAEASRWQRIGKMYSEHHFLNQTHRKTREEMLDLLRHAEHPFITTNAPAVCAPFAELCAVLPKTLTFGDLPEAADILIIHGLSMTEDVMQWMMQAEVRGTPILFTEDGFLRSVEPADGELHFAIAHAIQLDMGGLYIHADGPSLLEDSMNSDKVLDAAELARVRGLIARIRREKLSKYNHQRITGRQLGTLGRKKVLVIDQVYGDKSIAYGWATDATFLEMYQRAVEENPDADIFVKAHPVASKGHFASVQAGGRIHVLTEPMNPIELVEQMDKVYVCTSQLGFEAAFCGKEVHTFGMPFYAGWGFTIDAKHHPRRRKRRTVEEAFYFTYIACSVYVSYRMHDVCEIEQAIDELIELRNEYWNLHD